MNARVRGFVRTARWLAPVMVGLVALAQGTRADYERAAGLRHLTDGKVFRAKVEPHWFGDNTRFWYRNDLPGGASEFILVDAEQGTRAPAFDHARLADALAKVTSETVAADKLPLDWLEFATNHAALVFGSRDKWWRCDLQTYELTAETRNEAPVSSLPTLKRPHATRRTGEETSITFVNRTKAEAVIFWLNEEGEQRRYATVAPGDRYRQHTFAGHIWLAADSQGRELAVFEATENGGEAVIEEPATKSLPEPEKPAPPATPGHVSPDRRWAALIKDHNVWLRDLASGNESALSTDGTAGDAYGGEIFWSPDSRKLVAVRTKKGGDRKVYLVESSPKDQLQPKLLSYDYLKPGDPIPLPRPHLFDAVARKEIPVSDALFPNPWSAEDIRWDRESKQFTFVYNQRGHQVLRIIAVDAVSGAARAIVDEQSKTFIDYSGKFYAHYLEDTGEIIWMSERDGWNHLYLYDAATGQVKNQITRGEWVVRGVEHVDEKARQIWFRTGGIRSGQDPYYLHFCRVNFDGTGLTVLTEGDGSHRVQFSPNRRFLLDTWSRVDQPPVTELRRADNGRLVCELEHADGSALLQTGWRAPEPFVAKDRDGDTDIYGVIFRPTNFDPAKKYAVIEDIYAGPQDSFTPKEFRAFHGQQELAELGFIVVQMDGMGTSNRSKRFHDVGWKNLADAGFPDRILWIKAAAAQHPEMDLARLGIYGGSAGGQNALRALLDHGDFYKVCVADCGCHDNRMDKIWWNELWMGWPVDESYVRSSNVADAHKLQGKLLLIVGELDHNVDPSSTMQVVNALEKANKDFELLVITGSDHGAAESPYGKRRRADFFVRNLLGVEPRRDP
ncbi:MAG: DPP IV N-terminal domain-containing protein [Verrucomicrobiota bacterium]|jgi:dipeptidyl aminopeptidase/acylaminoacyl peptidase